VIRPDNPADRPRPRSFVVREFGLGSFVGAGFDTSVYSGSAARSAPHTLTNPHGLTAVERSPVAFDMETLFSQTAAGSTYE
jgi:hypothetical protein